jgi:PAS domain S-box-containing protein
MASDSRPDPSSLLAPPDSLLAAIVDSSDDAIVSKNLDGIITSWNAGAQRIFGYTPAEIVGQSVLKLIPTDRHGEEAAILQRLRRGERVDHFETVRVRRSGEQFPVSLAISPVKNAAGAIVGASKIARDITEMKRISAHRDQLLESERAARAFAENANRLKDEFLATVSHELRTPLNAILGWTEVLSLEGTEPTEVQHGIRVIQRNALMQAQLVDDLLDLSRITSGKMTLDIAPVDLRQIINEALSSVEHSIHAKQLAVKTIVGDIRGLLGDSKRLQQVIWNLLTNAIKFTPNHGRIVISAARVNSHVEIAVRDSGRGIAASFLPFLFERFRQADASTTRTHGGLGIGLSLVKQLVELHGGTVRAESPGEGLGATFTIYLPVAALHHEPPEPPESAASAEVKNESAQPDLHGIRVLAIDDDQDSLDVIERILRGRGAEVATAASVEAALEQVVSFKPDVLLSDIGMPGHDGYEFIRRVRALPEGASIPAAALTALARSEDRTRALTAGFQNHVSKPVASAEIVATVHSLASMRRR